MKLLLDTHILLWLVTDSPKLSSKARALIEDIDNECLFSPVSIAEISLKHMKHSDLLSFDGEAARSEFIDVGISEIPFTSTDAAGADSLVLFHNDPFDRMLLAQAKSEGIMIVSHDRQFPQYGDFVISV
jgi:PIN domain nuclease of toxin-antitoxin system